MAVAIYKLRSGAGIEVESSVAQPRSSGISEASALDKLTAGAWAATKGCKLGAKTGAVFVEGQVAANLEVTLTW